MSALRVLVCLRWGGRITGKKFRKDSIIFYDLLNSMHVNTGINIKGQSIVCQLKYTDSGLPVFATSGRDCINIWTYDDSVKSMKFGKRSLTIERPSDDTHYMYHVSCIFPRNDGSLLSGHESGHVILWEKQSNDTEKPYKMKTELKHGKKDPLGQRNPTNREVFDLCFLSGLSLVASTHCDKCIRLWDFQKSKLLHTNMYEAKNVRFWHERNLLVTSGADMTIQFFDLRERATSNWRSVSKFTNPNYDSINSIKILRAANQIVGGDLGGRLFGFDVRKSRKHLWNQKVHDMWIKSLRFNFERNQLLTCSGGNIVKVVQIEEEGKERVRIVKEIEFDKSDSIKDICLLGKRAYDSDIALLDLKERCEFVVYGVVEEEEFSIPMVVKLQFYNKNFVVIRTIISFS